MMDTLINEIIITHFRKRILSWGKENIRDFLWRYQQDPYRVLVSEFMLHRTQSRQVIPIYVAFLEKYPDLDAACAAGDQELRDILEPLGLNWRITGMINALRVIREKFGNVPADVELLMEIPGIGDYIAGATVCFTQNLPVALIDTNIVRVIGRVFGLSLIGEARRRKEMMVAIKQACDLADPRNYHYAMIDLAHMICVNRVPLCEICPLADLPCEYTRSLQEGN